MDGSCLVNSPGDEAKEKEFRRQLSKVFAVDVPAVRFYLPVAIFVTRVSCVVCFLSILVGIWLLAFADRYIGGWNALLVILGGFVSFCVNSAMLIVFRTVKKLRGLE